MFKMEEYKVYFDYMYEEFNNALTLGVFIVDPEGDAIGPITTKRIEGKGPQSKFNLEYSVVAFEYALEIAQSYGLEDIIMLNQNKLIFEWTANIKNTERDYVNRTRERMMTYYNTEGLNVSISYDGTIKGKDNLVKKELNRMKKKKGKATPAQSRGSFNQLAGPVKTYQLTPEQMKENKKNDKKVTGNKKAVIQFVNEDVPVKTPFSKQAANDKKDVKKASKPRFNPARFGYNPNQ